MSLRLAVLLLLLTHLAVGQDARLSEKAQISVITCNPWHKELYTAFGHSAIRVHDPLQAVNHVFNYGVFDFRQAHFYQKFVKGDLIYQLEVSSYADFIYSYIYQNRTVVEQVLNLTQEQKQRIFDYLLWNAQPENKGYYYDYFHDNCATRVRDVFTKNLSEELRLDSSFVRADSTLRELADRYLAHQPWGDLGIDISLGLPMDEKMPVYGYMFLPDYIESFFDKAMIMSAGESHPLVIKKQIIFESAPEQITDSFWSPWIVFGLFLVLTLGISWYDFRRDKLSRGFDFVTLLVTGLLGCLLVVFWVGTKHKATADNFNLLWALPFNSVMALLLWGKQRLLIYYFRSAFLLTIAVLLMWPLLPQELNVFLIPVVLSLAIRYGLNYWIRKKKAPSRE